MSRRFVAREGSCWTLSSVLHVLLRLLLRCGVVRRISAGRSLVSCLVLRFSRLQWRQQFGLLVRAQSAWWSCGCGLSEVSAYGAYESSAVLLSMAVSASSVCLASLFRKVKVVESVAVARFFRVCSAVIVSSLQRGVAAQR